MLEYLTRITRLLLTYFMGQGLNQVTKLFTGFILIRSLAKEDYAVFTVAMAIYGTAVILVELGIGQALTALIGSVHGDREAMGRYIAACRYYRNRMLVVGITALMVILYFLAPVYGWGTGLWLLVWGTISCSLIFRVAISMYRPVLLLGRELKRIYGLELVSGLVRLGLILLAYYLGYLSAEWAIGIGVVQTLVESLGYSKFVKGKFIRPTAGTDLSVERKALVGQTLPRVPGFTFLAFEGQITIFIISFLGTTSSIAELGALGRLGMLFVVFHQIGGVLIGPHMAKLKPPEVRRQVALIMSVSIVFFSIVALAGYLFPKPLLLILGDGYQHLGYEVFLIVLAASIKAVDAYLFSICSARRYINSWFSILDVGPVILVLILGFSLMDLSLLVNVLYYKIAISVVRLLSKATVFSMGIRGEARTVSE